MSKFHINLEIKNLDKLEAQLHQVKSLTTKTAKRLAREDVEELMAESRSQVPVDTGALQDSSYIEETPDGLKFGYGGAHAQFNSKRNEYTTEYQLAVHERLDVYHTNGKAKFLEDPVNEYGSRMEETFTQKMKGWFKSIW